MKRVVIYTRVSTDEQKEKGYSLQDQEARLRRECDRKGYIVVGHYQEDNSAKSFNRPAFKKFQEDLINKRVKPDIFFCLNYGRFSRNLEDHLSIKNWLKGKGVELETLEQKHDLRVPENYLAYILEAALPQI